MNVSFTVPGEPVAQGRPRITTINGRARAFDPKKSRSYKAVVSDRAENAMKCRAPIEGAVDLSVTAYFTCPKSRHRKRTPRAQEPRVQRPDIDNVVKAIKDAMTGIVWLDDSQVVRLQALKFTAAQGEPPKVEVIARPFHQDQTCV